MFVQHCLDKNWLIMVISILKLSMLACLSSIYCSLGILLLLQFQLNCKYMSSLHFQVMAIVSFAAGFSHNATKATGERINFHFKWRFFIHIKKNFIWNGDRVSEEMQQYHCFKMRYWHLQIKRSEMLTISHRETNVLQLSQAQRSSICTSRLSGAVILTRAVASCKCSISIRLTKCILQMNVRKERGRLWLHT